VKRSVTHCHHWRFLKHDIQKLYQFNLNCIHYAAYVPEIRLFLREITAKFSQSQRYITTGSQSASPSWYQAPISDPQPIFHILSLINVFDSGAPSLTRSRVCAFQFLPGIASAAFLRSESQGTHQYKLWIIYKALKLR
jgi:hypothetical protein